MKHMLFRFRFAFVLAFCIMLIGSVSLCVFAEEPTTSKYSASLAIGIKNELNGQVKPDENVKFSFEISAEDVSSPMPKEKTIDVFGSGDISFSDIVFTKPGIYYYIVTPQKGENKNITYDLTAYNIAVVVKNIDGDVNKGLVATIAAVENIGTGKKVDEGGVIQRLIFNNIISISSAGGSGDPNGSNDGSDGNSSFFNNPYTGAVGGPIFSLILLFAALVVLVITIIMKKRFSNNDCVTDYAVSSSKNVK